MQSPEALIRLILKYNANPYLKSETEAMGMILGINGAIAVDMCMGVPADSIVEAMDTRLLQFPMLVVRRGGWDQAWASVVELFGPEHIEEALFGLCKGDRAMEMSVWGGEEGVSMVVKVVQHHDFGYNDGDKRRAMGARGWEYHGGGSSSSSNSDSDDDDDREEEGDDDDDGEEEGVQVLQFYFELNRV